MAATSNYTYKQRRTSYGGVKAIELYANPSEPRHVVISLVGMDGLGDLGDGKDYYEARCVGPQLSGFTHVQPVQFKYHYGAPHRVDALASFIEAFKQENRVSGGKVVIIGHSDGATMAVKFLHKYHSLVHGVILIAPMRYPSSQVIDVLRGLPFASYAGNHENYSCVMPNHLKLKKHLPGKRYLEMDDRKPFGHSPPSLHSGGRNHSHLVASIEAMFPGNRGGGGAAPAAPARNPKRVLDTACVPESFQRFCGLNCYNGNGGRNLLGTKCASRNLSVEDAIALCLRTTGAVAFTYQPSTGNVWLLSHVDPGKGVSSNQYDVYKL